MPAKQTICAIKILTLRFFFLQKRIFFFVLFCSNKFCHCQPSRQRPREIGENERSRASCQVLPAAGGCSWRRIALTLLPRAQLERNVAEQGWWQQRKLTKVLLWASLVSAEHRQTVAAATGWPDGRQTRWESQWDSETVAGGDTAVQWSHCSSFIQPVCRRESAI